MDGKSPGKMVLPSLLIGVDFRTEELASWSTEREGFTPKLVYSKPLFQSELSVNENKVADTELVHMSKRQ